MNIDCVSQPNQRNRRLWYGQAQAEQIGFRHTNYRKGLGVGIGTGLHQRAVVHVAAFRVNRISGE
jgi:hypothetical protein